MILTEKVVLLIILPNITIFTVHGTVTVTLGALLLSHGVFVKREFRCRRFPRTVTALLGLVNLKICLDFFLRQIIPLKPEI